MKRIFLSAVAALSLLTTSAPLALAATNTSTTTSQTSGSTSGSGTFTPDSTLPIVVE
ncbi:hypothetical protein [Alicyclobacillus macrosporangiidus]|uniref:hypothetical protein n=1 Tax=Alicyclobacillus macrosporangiidus TaxID=392015 RepID=UPI0015877A69|nr:hypothetical protein [Alicyclobacillus macrosporangiidus]